MNDKPQPALVENMLLLKRDDFEELLHLAAERGAQRMLARLGLEQGNAAQDIDELRALLEAWRATRRAAWLTLVRAITVALLAALLIGLAAKLRVLERTQ
jgi:hypothetical protein